MLRRTFRQALALSLSLGIATVFLELPREAQAQTNVQVETLKRLKGLDLDANQALKAKILGILKSIQGSADFLELVAQFEIKELNSEVLETALANDETSAGAEGIRYLLEQGEVQEKHIAEALSQEGESSVKLAKILGNIPLKQSVKLLTNQLVRKNATVPQRRATALALTKSKLGAESLLKLAEEDKLPPSVKLLTASALSQARWPNVKKSAAMLLPLPSTMSQEPLPPIEQLAKLKGSVEDGKLVFNRPTSMCAICHQVNGQGIDFGPSLSEIGDKLGKDALYESILTPSAGISFDYEAWMVETRDGEEGFGIIVSDTENELALKAQTGIVTRYLKSEISIRQKQPQSIMPEGLQAGMTQQDLVNLIEYLASLKKQ
jgi:putative heme-binding domain-containing protein